jgi:hypothetical protein
MAYKHQTKGRNKRRTQAIQKAKGGHISQDKYRSLLNKLAQTVLTVKGQQQILTQAPPIFNVRPMIERGEIDPKLLDAKKLVECGKQILLAEPTLATRIENLLNRAADFLDHAYKVNFGGLSEVNQLKTVSQILEIQSESEAWAIDFTSQIHGPLLEAIDVLNKALPEANRVDVKDMLNMVNALKLLTNEQGETNV